MHFLCSAKRTTVMPYYILFFSTTKIYQYSAIYLHDNTSSVNAKVREKKANILHYSFTCPKYNPIKHCLVCFFCLGILWWTELTILKVLLKPCHYMIKGILAKSRLKSIIHFYLVRSFSHILFALHFKFTRYLSNWKDVRTVVAA